MGLPDEQLIDVTELQAAIAALNGCEPPSGRAVVSAAVLSPISTRVKKEEEEAAAIAAAAAAEKEAHPEIGDQMQDGSVYAGLTEDGTQKIFAMPKDIGVTMIFNDAAQRVAQLNADEALGHNDWQIPVLENLRILQKNQAEGELKGTFKKIKTASLGGSDFLNWYWSAADNGSSMVHDVCFSDGDEGWITKDSARLSCRAVRLVPVAPA